MSDSLLDWDSNIPTGGGGDDEAIGTDFSRGTSEGLNLGDDGKRLEQYVKEFEERQAKKVSLKKENVEASKQRPDESFFTKLDSNLKKNTNFVRKLKTFSDSQRDSLLKDFKSLNLNKYVAEIAINLCEAKLKMSDVLFMVEFCSLMHQRYADFSSTFMDAFKKSFPVLTKQQKLTDVEKWNVLSNPSKFRVDLRLLSELIVVGVFPEKEALNILGSTLKYLSSNPGNDYRHLPLVITFLKFCGDDYAGIVPGRIRKQCEQFNVPVDRLRSNLLTVERQKTVRSLFVDYYRELAEKYIIKMFRELKQIERQNRRQYETKGEVFPEAQQRWEEAKGNFEKLHQNVLQLADLLDQNLPELPEIAMADEVETQTGDTSIGLVVGGGVFEKIDVGGGLWEDEDTRMFYETLPELRVMLPGILFKESEQATLAPVEEKIDEVGTEEEPQQQQQSMGDDQQQQQSMGDDQQQQQSMGDDQQQQEQMEETPEPEESGEKGEDEEEVAGVSSTGTGGSSNTGTAVTGSLLKQMMDTYLAELPNTINRDLIDRAAVDFVTNLNTKPNRKRLVKALFNVPRNRQDLLPFYGRLMAILKPVMPDVSTELVRMLMTDFRYQMKKKEPVYVESKVKVLRFIGELVKFKIFPKSESLHCLKILLYDFRHHHIDMACALLDTCGRFLYCSPDSHQKTKILLEQMERKSKAAMYVEQRYQLMVDNALATCKPDSTVTQREKIELPPWQEYMRKLIFKDLEKSAVEKVLKQLRKFNWEDPVVSAYAVSCLSQPWNMKFSCVQWLASLLAGVMYYYDFVGHQVVDNILEEFRIGMEINHHRFNQRRLCCARYLAEMYNYRVVDSPIIFNALYSLITFGISYDPTLPGFLDPPEHLLRIRLACFILETCGEYFDRGMAKKRLDCYLSYFQRYYWHKKRASCWSTDFPFPLEIENVLKDTIEYLRPSLKLCTNYEEAETAVKQMEDEYRHIAESALKFIQVPDDQRQQRGGEEEWEEERGPPLRPIAEEDEEGVRISASQDSACASQTQGAFGVSGSLGSQGAGGGDWRGPSMERDSDEENAFRTSHTGKEEENVFRVRNRPGNVVDPEDEEFTAAFDRLMAESVQQRMQETVKPTVSEIPLPVNAKLKLAARTHFEDGTEPAKDVSSQAEEYVNFGLLLKGKGGGGRHALKSIKVPATSDLACLLKDRELEEQLEKERMKQLTLNISRRMQQEEEMAEMADLKKKVTENLAPRSYSKVQHPPQQQQQRSSGAGFQHQRGAPGPQEAFSKNWQRH